MTESPQTNDAFPVSWDEPWQAGAFWPRDAVHFPRALSPLGASIVPALEYDGIEAAAETLALPARILARVANGFVYNTILPRAASHDAQEALEHHHAAVMAEQIVQLPQRWRRELQPELEELNRRLLLYNLSAATDEALTAHFDDAIRTLRRHWQVHFLVVLPVFAAGGALVRVYESLFGANDERAPYRLLQGLENRTLQADQGLWRLARVAEQSPSVAQALLSGAGTDEISGLEDGAAFFEALRAFLAVYGGRISAADDLLDATWAEDPRFVLRAIAGHLATRNASPEERQEQQAAARAEELSGLLNRINGSATRERFIQILQEAQAVWPLREDHTHVIDQPTFAILRRIALEFGSRLAGRGILRQRDDVFMLTRPEAEIALSGQTGLQELAVERRTEFQQRLRSTPPPFIGTPPTEGASPSDPELAKFFGRPPEPEKDRRTLNGIAASPGRARGPARVVLSLEDFDSVRPGDVLVCPSTTPPWTPLFGIVAALVTEAGGVLSHGAIVAREYGLPAVTAVTTATQRLQTGQIIEVDGEAGQVHLLDPGL